MNWLARLLDLFRPRVKPPPPPDPPPASTPSPGLPDYVAKLNAMRVFNGRPSVAHSPEATAAAEVQSHTQASRDRIGHDGPPGQVTEADRLAVQGVRNVACGEIVAEGPPGFTFDQAIALWLRSPGHATILLGSYTHAGAAMATAASGNVYATAVFYRA